MRCMVDCASQGHGCDNLRAIKSADRLISFVEKLIHDEGLCGHSAGYSEGRRGR